MSLINDALKRASQADKDRARPNAGATPGMIAAPTSRRSLLPFAIVGMVVVAALLTTSWLLWRVLSRKPQFPQAKPSTTLIVHSATPPPPPIAASASVEKPVLSAPIVAAAIPLPPTNARATEVSTPTALPSFPAVKLQAIFFSRANPHALINGQTVGDGDAVAGATVKTITARSVLLEWKGQTREFLLAGP